MEYTYTLHARGHIIGSDTVIANSQTEALTKLASLGRHHMRLEKDGGIELHLASVDPIALDYLKVPRMCQMCLHRPVRRVISTPWDMGSPFLFICDTPAEDGSGEHHCMQTYVKRYDCKKFDMPPATMDYSTEEWVSLMNDKWEDPCYWYFVSIEFRDLSSTPENSSTRVPCTKA